jgi:hypothetical protein
MNHSAMGFNRARLSDHSPGERQLCGDGLAPAIRQPSKDAAALRKKAFTRRPWQRSWRVAGSAALLFWTWLS